MMDGLPVADGMTHEEMVESLCSFSGQEEGVVQATLEEAEWNFEKASLQLHEDVRYKRPRNANTNLPNRGDSVKNRRRSGSLSRSNISLHRTMTFTVPKTGKISSVTSKKSRSVFWLELVNGTDIFLKPRGVDSRVDGTNTSAHHKLMRRNIYCNIEMGKQKSSSKVVRASSNPIWNECFSFWLERGKETMLSIKVFTQDDNQVGYGIAKVRAPKSGTELLSAAQDEIVKNEISEIHIDLDAAGFCSGSLHLTLRRSLQPDRSPIAELLLYGSVLSRNQSLDGKEEEGRTRRKTIENRNTMFRPGSLMIPRKRNKKDSWDKASVSFDKSKLARRSSMSLINTKSHTIENNQIDTIEDIFTRLKLSQDSTEISQTSIIAGRSFSSFRGSRTRTESGTGLTAEAAIHAQPIILHILEALTKGVGSKTLRFFSATSLKGMYRLLQSGQSVAEANLLSIGEEMRTAMQKGDRKNIMRLMKLRSETQRKIRNPTLKCLKCGKDAKNINSSEENKTKSHTQRLACLEEESNGCFHVYCMNCIRNRKTPDRYDCQCSRIVRIMYIFINSEIEYFFLPNKKKLYLTKKKEKTVLKYFFTIYF